MRFFKESPALSVRVTWSACPRAGRERPSILPALSLALPPPAPPASSTHRASPTPESGAVRMCAAHRRGFWRLVAPGVTPQGRGRLWARPLPPPSPHPQPLSVGLREGALRPSSPTGGGLRQAGLGRCPWAGNWARKQGIPQRGPSPAGGWTRTKGDLFFLGMPAPSQTYLQPHFGDSYTHTAAQSLPGWGMGVDARR